MRHSRRGVVATEFALLFPVYAMVLFALVDVSWLFYQQSLLDHAAAIGCRQGALQDAGVNGTQMSAVLANARVDILEVMKTTDGTDCSGCTVNITTFGSPPGRTMVCSVSREMSGLTTYTPIGPIRLEGRFATRFEIQRSE